MCSGQCFLLHSGNLSSLPLSSGSKHWLPKPQARGGIKSSSYVNQLRAMRGLTATRHQARCSPCSSYAFSALCWPLWTAPLGSFTFWLAVSWPLGGKALRSPYPSQPAKTWLVWTVKDSYSEISHTSFRHFSDTVSSTLMDSSHCSSMEALE